MTKWGSFVSAVTSFLPDGFPFTSARTEPLLAPEDAMKRAQVIVDPSRILSGWVFAPYNQSALVTRKGLGIFDHMKRDEQVKACLAFKKAAMLSPGWEVVSPGDQDEEWEVTELVRDNFNHFPDGWDKALKKLLLNIDYGYSVTEKVYADPTETGDEYTKLVRLSSVKPHYIDFFNKPTGELLSVIQRYVPGSTRELEIPVDKCVIHTHDGEFENTYGRSELEAAYRPWWVKDNAYKWFAIYLERHGMAPLFGMYNPNVYQGQQLEELKKIVKNIQNATMGIIPRNQPDDLEIWSQTISAQSRDIFLSAISRFDADIGRSILVPALIGATSDSTGAGGEQAKGSYARSQTHFDLFIMTVEEEQGLLATVVNEQIVKQLCDLNFPNLETYPEFRFLPLDDGQKMELYTTWAQLVAGKVVNRIPDDETHIRKVFDFPENEDPVVEVLPMDKPKPGFDEEGRPFPKPAGEEVPGEEQTDEMKEFADEHDAVWVQYGEEAVAVPYAEWDESKHPRVPAGSEDGGQFGGGGGGGRYTSSKTMGGWRTEYEGSDGTLIEYGKIKPVIRGQYPHYYLREGKVGSSEFDESKFKDVGPSKGKEKLQARLSKIGVKYVEPEL